MDLAQLTEGRPCANRLSSRIVVLQTELRGIVSASRASWPSRWACASAAMPPGRRRDQTAGSTALGTLLLDEQGVFELVDIPRLVSEDRQAFLFPAAERGP